jgi:small-conductance mechanosensitive channel
MTVLTAGIYPWEAIAQETPPKPSEVKTPALPELNSFVPLASSLSDRLDTLKRRLQNLPDGGSMQKTFEAVADALDGIEERLKALNQTDVSSNTQLVEIRSRLRSESDRIRGVNERIGDGLKLIQAALKEWDEERAKWYQWRQTLSEADLFPSLQTVFNSATATIESAEGLLTQKIPPLIELQRRSWRLQSRFSALAAEVDARTVAVREETLGDAASLLFSAAYLKQLPRALTEDLPNGIRNVALPGRPFFERQWYLIVIQIGFAVLVAVFLRRFSTYFSHSARTRLLTRRPVSTAFFVSLVLFTAFYQLMPSLWFLLIQLVAAAAAVRIISGLVGNAYEKRLIYALLATKILMGFVQVFGVPLPLVRLVIFTAALSGIAACMPPLVMSIRNARTFKAWTYALIQLSLAFVMISEFLGFNKLARYLFDGALETVLLVISAWIFILFLRAVTELVLRSRLVQKVPVLRSSVNAIVAKAVFVYYVAVGAWTFVEILSRWKVFADSREALAHIFTFGVTIGSLDITVGLVGTALAVLYGAFIVSWTLQSLLMEGALTRRPLDTGVRISIGRLIHYAVVLAGFIVALAALGLELRNITIIGGALGVGIGFGLQTIVNNFVCGLIMLFERPIKVGDVIELEGNYGEIKRVGLRATVVQTYDNAELVVPNADLIANRVTNWTLAERRMRLRLPVGVAYGSDVEQVIKTLAAVADGHPLVLKVPNPQVVFLGFGESSLDFDLRVWIADFDNSIIVRSQLNQEVDRRFRENGIEIPFPQRDLHLRSTAGTVTPVPLTHPEPSPTGGGSPGRETVSGA